MQKLKIGIVGCGAIGSYIAKSCQKDLSDRITLSGICDSDNSKAATLSKKLKNKVDIYTINEIVKISDLIIEAASKDVASAVAKKALESGKSVMVMSIGGLLGKEDLFKLAREKNAKIYLPSGAICGLDALKAASIAGIKKVTLTTKKSPKSLEGAPYLLEKKIDLTKIDKETTIFEGSASEAVKGFPKNINVAALLSLAGIGAKKTKVKIIASPSINCNIHEILVNGNFGSFTTRTENIPFPENPKTSFLAALSAVATLKSIVNEVKIGT